MTRQIGQKQNQGWRGGWATYILIQDNYIKLAWEPSPAKVTKSYSRRLPALERFYRETKFSLKKLTHST